MFVNKRAISRWAKWKWIKTFDLFDLACTYYLYYKQGVQEIWSEHEMGTNANFNLMCDLDLGQNQQKNHVALSNLIVLPSIYNSKILQNGADSKSGMAGWFKYNTHPFSSKKTWQCYKPITIFLGNLLYD